MLQVTSGRGCQIGKTVDCSTAALMMVKLARSAVSAAYLLHAGPGHLLAHGRDPGNLGTGSVLAADTQRPEVIPRSSGSQALCSVSE